MQRQMRKYSYRGYGAAPMKVLHRIVLRILGDSINENRRLKPIYAETVCTVSLLVMVCDIFYRSGDCFFGLYFHRICLR